MAISLVRYVSISSAVLSGTVVATRQLILNIFTVSTLLPPQSYITFNTPAEVGSYFGTGSEEFLRASTAYFNFISKNNTTPQLIQFTRWVNASVPPMIFGYGANTTVANWSAITTGALGLTIGANTFNLEPLNFSSATSLANVATIIQTAINAETGGGAMWTAATVTYNSATANFDFVGGADVAFASGNISVEAGTGGVDISQMLGWLPAATTVNNVFIPGAIFAYSSLLETITTTLANAYAANNNFGTIIFEYVGINSGAGLTLPQYEEAATWNASLTPNVQFELSVPVLAANASTWAAGLAGFGGTSLTLVAITTTGAAAPTQYWEQIPAMIKAATAYNAPAINSVQNYMFQIFSFLSATVTSDTVANAMDALKINYIGLTQNAGQQLAFYQRGLMQGPATLPQDQNVYANEQWLKSALAAAIMTLLLSASEVPANPQGQTMILTILLSVVSQAIANGTIEIGKTLSAQQISDITQITGDPNAWYQVSNSGYWLNVTIQQILNSNPIQYKAVYVLAYGKNDVIRLVEGSDDLI